MCLPLVCRSLCRLFAIKQYKVQAHVPHVEYNIIKIITRIITLGNRERSGILAGYIITYNKNSGTTNKWSRSKRWLLSSTYIVYVCIHICSEK